MCAHTEIWCYDGVRVSAHTLILYARATVESRNIYSNAIVKISGFLIFLMMEVGNINRAYMYIYTFSVSVLSSAAKLCVVGTVRVYTHDKKYNFLNTFLFRVHMCAIWMDR